MDQVVTSRAPKPARPRFATPILVVALMGVLGLYISAAAAASSGGAGMGPGPGATGTAQPGNLVVTASTNGMTIAARESALLRANLQVAGTLPSADAHRIVEIQVRGARTGWQWDQVASAPARGDGSFAAVWRANHAGKLAVRAVVGQGSARTASGLPTITVTVYRPALATLYGPGFYGRRTACGTILRRRTLGVANRTLPCGTPVSLYYQGRVMVVPVIDRGPYANGANWDLTMATGKALGMDATARIGAVALPPSH